MLSYKKILVLCLLAIALIASPGATFAANPFETQQNSNRVPPDPGAMAADLVIVRPLGMVATLGGTLVFIVSLPFSALGENMDDAWESLVVSPATFTFQRPLGEFDN